MLNISLTKYSTAERRKKLLSCSTASSYLIYALMIQLLIGIFLFTKNNSLKKEISALHDEITKIEQQSKEFSDLRSTRKDLIEYLETIKNGNAQSLLITKSLSGLLSTHPNLKLNSLSLFDHHLELTIQPKPKQAGDIETYLKNSELFKNMSIEKNISNLNNNTEIHISAETSK